MNAYAESDFIKNHPRNVARRAGEARYTTGKPCRRCGSKGPRYVICGRCCACQAERNRKYRTRLGKDYANARSRAFRLANPDYDVIRSRKRAGLPEPTRPCLGFCENCGRHEKEFAKRLHLDHCHKTGKFRGWLCSECNTGLGKLGDDIGSLRKAIAYLERAS